MKNEDIESNLKINKLAKERVVENRKPIFNYSSLCFNVLAIWSLYYLFRIHKPKGGMDGMFDGYQYIFVALAAMVIGFICTVIGYVRKERLNILLKINLVFSCIFALLVWIFFKN